MVFSSLFFLFQFLPLTLLAYYLAPARAKNAVLLAASLFFYAWGAPRFVFVLVATALFDYLLGAGLAGGGRAARVRLTIGLVANALALLYFKYANFFVDQLNALLHACGSGPVAWTRVALPIGISFFTFHQTSYLVDVYRGHAKPARSFADYLLYVSLFPQLIAGPIVRYHDVAAQIAQRRHDAARFASGVCRFGLGLGKKVLLANALAEVADAAFGAKSLAPGPAWTGALAYAFQIYFDFSGYSDMAIGLGRMFGIEFLENFRTPYLSASITEFWRRWHISLSTFMREYLYIPLGGSRATPRRAMVNLWIVFLISGFWHGASWNFIVWGAYHGLFLTLDKLNERAGRGPLPRAAAVPLTFLVVLFSWVFFRAESLAAAVGYLRSMAGLGAPAAAAATDAYHLTVLVVAALAIALPALPAGRGQLKDVTWLELAPRAQAALGAGALLLVFLATMVLSNGGFNPFIYFRF